MTSTMFRVNLDRDAPTGLYEQVAADIRGRLPTEKQGWRTTFRRLADGLIGRELAPDAPG